MHARFFGDASWPGRYSAHPMRRVKSTFVAILRLLGVAMVLALIILLVEVLAGVILVGLDALFR